MKDTLTDASMSITLKARIHGIQDQFDGFTMFVDFPRTADQRVYHLGVGPGEVANRIARDKFHLIHQL